MASSQLANKLQQEAKELVNLKIQQKEAEENLAALNTRIRYKEENVIPNLMDDLDMTKVSFSDMDISKSIKYRSTITKANQDEAFKYLIDSDNEKIIKKILTVDVNENPDIIKILDEKGIIYDISQSVHHATLSKVITELVEDGKLSTEDFETFSIYTQPIIKIKLKD